VILWGKNILRVFENRMLREIFGPRRDKTTGGWRKLQNELYSLPGIIRMVKHGR
jgi:methyl coenzyme M reductase subunit D